MSGIDTTLRWINLRNTLAYVTDGANQYSPAVGGLATPTYPTALTINGASVNVGFTDTGGTSESRDRNSAIDPRLAGDCFISQNGSSYTDFKVVLPASGQYEIHFAIGDAGNALTNFYAEIRDTTTVLATPVNASGGAAANQFYDATGALRTSDTDWVANETGVTLTFATTLLVIRLGNTAFSASATPLATVGIKQISAGQSIMLMGQPCL